MKTHTVDKLFHGGYRFKISILGPNVGVIFSRDNITKNSTGKLSNIIKPALTGGTCEFKRQRYNYISRTMETLTYAITEPQAKDISKVINIIKQFNDCRTMVSSGTFFIYFNAVSVDAARELISSVKSWNVSLSYVDDTVYDFLISNKKTVVAKTNSGHRYKVTLKWGKIDQNVADFLIKNTGKIKAGDSVIHAVKNGFVYYNQSLLVDTPKTLTMVELALGNLIQKIENVVYKEELDKYSHEHDK